MEYLRKGINFTTVSFWDVYQMNHDEILQVKDTLQKFIDTGFVQPLNRNTFLAKDLKASFK